MIDLKAKPFCLNDTDIQWVNDTLSAMTLEEKAGQVFCPMGFSDDPGLLHHMLCDLHVGGMMYRPGPAAYIQNTHRAIQSMAKIPLLLAANTENGGNGLAFDWRLLAGRQILKPWLLAGGLTPDNVAEAIRLTRAQGVDVSSGVESAPGVKDPERIRRFIARATAPIL